MNRLWLFLVSSWFTAWFLDELHIYKNAHGIMMIVSLAIVFCFLSELLMFIAKNITKKIKLP